MSALGQADVCSATAHVRSYPESRLCGARSDVRLGPIADILAQTNFDCVAREIGEMSAQRELPRDFIDHS